MGNTVSYVLPFMKDDGGAGAAFAEQEFQRALEIAIRRDNVEALEALLAEEAASPSPRGIDELALPGPRPLLHGAAGCGASGVISHILDVCGGDVDVTDGDGNTPLMAAVLANKPDVAALLISQYDANYRVGTKTDGRGIGHVAAKLKYVDFARLMAALASPSVDARRASKHPVRVVQTRDLDQSENGGVEDGGVEDGGVEDGGEGGMVPSGAGGESSEQGEQGDEEGDEEGDGDGGTVANKVGPDGSCSSVVEQVLNAKDAYGLTPLHVAVLGGNIEAIKTVLATTGSPTRALTVEDEVGRLSAVELGVVFRMGGSVFEALDGGEERRWLAQIPESAKETLRNLAQPDSEVESYMHYIYDELVSGGSIDDSGDNIVAMVEAFIR